MFRRTSLAVLTAMMVILAGCGGSSSSELAVPAVAVSNSGTSQVSPSFINAGLEGAVPAGVQVAFVGDVVALRGENFGGNTRAFLGMNNELAKRPNSLLTTVRHLLPADPFVYTDPVTGQKTILEIETKVEVSHSGEIRIVIPPAVACSDAFSNPIVRFYGTDGSSFPRADVLFIVGPRCIALAPNKGVDIGGFDVTLHGDFISPFTQIAFRYVDPADGLTKVIGDTVATDIEEFFVDRHTLVVQNWPGVVPNSTFGLAEPLEVDILIFENIDEIAAAGPDPSPCSGLTQESPDAPLMPNGVRNSEKIGGFTFLPTGVTDYPSIAGIVPESGTELGGNTVIIHGDQFDAFTADISNPNDPGIGIECPPDSGNYVAPIKAILVDRQTLVVVMPPCAVDVPQKVNFCLRNKYSLDRGGEPGGPPVAGPNGDCVIFEDIYEYTPIPPIVEPIVTAIYPATPETEQPNGCGNDYGLQRFMVVGDWFDSNTTLNGGFEFILPDREGLPAPTPEGGNPRIVQALRVILHNRNLIEVFTPRLPEPYYPLTSNILADVRVRNVVGHADFAGAFTFKAFPAATDAPALNDLCPKGGPLAGGNEVMIIGENFDTTTTNVTFGGIDATDIQFINANLLVVRAPAGNGPVPVEVINGIGTSASMSYTYSAEPDPSYNAPVLGALDPNEGSQTGGYQIMAYGANLGPLTQVEFGVDLTTEPITRSGNFSHNIFFLSTNALLVTVPRAFEDQVGATIGVGASDPLAGHPDPIKTVEFKYLPRTDCMPEIHYVDTSVEVPVTPTVYPALSMGGGDSMLVIGKCFDQETTFDITKPQGGENTSDTTEVVVLSTNIAVMKSPESPDGLPGLADLQAHNSLGDSNDFTVEYVQPGPPEIFDVRNLDDGTQTSPIDANDRLIIFGDNFVRPLTVVLEGCNLQNQTQTLEVTINNDDVTVVEDHLIGINVPPNTFCQGPLAITVTTPFGSTSFEDEGGPIFELIGPQPPEVTGVFPSKFLSHGGEEAVFFGRNFTPTTQLSVRTDSMPAGVFANVLEQHYVSETVFLVLMPALPGGMPPVGVEGDVKAEETDVALINKIAPADPFKITTDLFNVCNDDSPILLAVVPDTGTIDGGEQVLLLGNNFLQADGSPNVSDIKFYESGTLTEVGDYQDVPSTSLPLTSADKGKYHILNTHQILVITNPHDKIFPEHVGAPIDIVLESTNGDSMLNGSFTYFNTPPVRTPTILSIVANETRWNGGTSHLLSGAFLSEADRIVFQKGAETVTIPVDKGMFSEVNDNFLTFVMPDLRPSFAEGDLLDVFVEKDFEGSVLKSNTLTLALKVTFAGPPTITPTLSPNTGSAFGGDIVTINGSFFTTNSQVLFGTLPAKHVVYVSPTEIIAITPSLATDLPSTDVDLTGITASNGTVDVAVFTQGGWAVLKDGFQFKPETPVVDSCTDDPLAEGDMRRIQVFGNFFVPGDTTVTPSVGGGTVANLVVHSMHELSFDYTAPSFAPGTDGSFTDMLTVATGQGGDAASTCDLVIWPDPEIDDCETSYTLNDKAAPTTGVESSVLVKATITGKNFLAGGKLWITTRGSSTPIPLTENAALNGAGQFKVDDKNTITMTVPYVFPANTPTLTDGNPNVGPVDVRYESPLGRDDTDEGCFSYVPALMGFSLFSYSLPADSIVVQSASPHHITCGDINADGMPDAAILGTHPEDAWVLMADTFGPSVDVNGDGITPDFAGTYTRTAIIITQDKFSVLVDPRHRGKSIQLGNLDGDAQLEILIPGYLDPLTNNARIAIQDVDGTGLTTVTLFEPGTTESFDTNSLAVGDFDGDARDDFAYITDHATDATKRRLGIVTSPGGAFTWTENLYALHSSADDYVPGKLTAGDWDGNGIDDLIYGFIGSWPNAFTGNVDNYKVIVVKIDGAGGVTSQTPVDDFSPRAVEQIVAADLDNDGNDEAIVLVDTEAKSTTLFAPFVGADKGFAIIMDPSAALPTVTKYIPTGYQNRWGTSGDFNGDGAADLAVMTPVGEFTIFTGDGKGGFNDSGQTWQPVRTESMQWPFQAITACDMNNDLLDEILVPDNGVTPKNMILWLNTSR